VIVAVAAIVVVADPVIVAVHVNGNATVDVIERAQGSMRALCKRPWHTPAQPTRGFPTYGREFSFRPPACIRRMLEDRSFDHAHGGVPVQVHGHDHGRGHDHGHGHGYCRPLYAFSSGSGVLLGLKSAAMSPKVS
jgi:hypothetical protein